MGRYSQTILCFSLALVFYPPSGLAQDPTQFAWMAPTTNEDLTSLTDLAGFKIYCGASSGVYNAPVNVADPLVRTYPINGVVGVGNHFCITTAYNTVGTESVFSNEVNFQISQAGVPVAPVNIVVSSQVAISGLVISDTTPITYIWDNLVIGLAIYIDRVFKYIVVPTEYIGLKVLRTANDDKASPEGVSFRISVAATVFVIWDDLLVKPAWLASWQDTGDDVLTGSNVIISILRKDFSAGIVQLGQNSSGLGSMYTVMVR